MEPKRQRPTLTKHAQALSDCISTPLGELHFTAFLASEKVTQDMLKSYNKQKQNSAKIDPKVTLLGSRPHGKWVYFCCFLLRGARLSTESLKVTLGAPKCLQELSKIIESVTSNS